MLVHRTEWQAGEITIRGFGFGFSPLLLVKVAVCDFIARIECSSVCHAMSVAVGDFMRVSDVSLPRLPVR